MWICCLSCVQPFGKFKINLLSITIAVFDGYHLQTISLVTYSFWWYPHVFFINRTFSVRISWDKRCFVLFITKKRPALYVYNVTLRRVLTTIVAVEKQWVLHDLSGALVALGIQLGAILSSVACPVLQYFSTFSHKRQDFRKKKLLNTKYVFFYFLCDFCLKHFRF